MDIRLTPSREDTVIPSANKAEEAVALTIEQKRMDNEKALLKVAKDKADLSNKNKVQSALKKLKNKTLLSGLNANAAFSSGTGPDAYDPNDPAGLNRFINPNRTFEQRLNKLNYVVADVGIGTVNEDIKVTTAKLDTNNEVVKKTALSEPAPIPTPAPIPAGYPQPTQLMPMKAALWTGIDDVTTWKLSNFKTIKDNLGSSAYSPFLLDSWGTGTTELYAVGQGTSSTEAINNALVGYKCAQLNQQQEQGTTTSTFNEPSPESLRTMVVNLLIQQLFPAQSGLPEGPKLISIFDTNANKERTLVGAGMPLYDVDPASPYFLRDPTSIQPPIYAWIGG